MTRSFRRRLDRLSRRIRPTPEQVVEAVEKFERTGELPLHDDQLAEWAQLIVESTQEMDSLIPANGEQPADQNQ
jgi:hypothetical protein